MNAWLHDLHTIVFDLDGTLYQDHDFVARYVAHLVRGTEHEASTAALQRTAEQILRGVHPFQLDHWYDTTHHCCVVHDGVQATHTYGWDGSAIALAAEAVPAAYRDAALWAEEAAQRRLLYAGDAWSVVAVLASRLGIPEANRGRAFLTVREEMITPPHGVHKHERLIEAVRTMPQRKMLLTNSPGETASAFVSYLGLDGAFDYVAYGSGKPDGLAALLERLIEGEGIPASRILSIGDHAWNDLTPAQQAGCRTIVVAPYADDNTHTPWNMQVRTLDELADVLETIQSISKEEHNHDRLPSAR